MTIGKTNSSAIPSIRLALVASLIVLATGCVSEFKPGGNSNLILPDEEQMETIHRMDDFDGTSMAAMTSLTTAFQVKRLGGVEFNGATLPLVSFTDGGHIATQTGRPPSARLLTGNASNRTEGMSVAVYRLDGPGGPQRTGQSDDGILLGRNGNQNGFLVERPNTDGSRSIGMASWIDGNIDWIIDDGNVNAFGWVSQSGRIVFSSRRVEDSNFVIAVRETDGSRWDIEETLPYTWMFPVFEADGQSIFAVRLGDGYADMTHGSLSSANDFRDTMKSHRMSNRTDATRISQMVSTSTSGPKGNGLVIPWYSYELGRMVVWDVDRLEVQLLPEGSVSAFPMDTKRNWLVTTGEGLDRTALFVSDRAEDRLIDFPWLARHMSGNQVFIIEPLDRVIKVAMIEFGSATE